MMHERPGASVEWYTPAWIFERMAATFDLDVASPGMAAVPWIPARACITGESLTQMWHGFVWMNPPWGREIGRWVEKWAAHPEGVALVPVRTDTKWGQAALLAADVTCFIAGRVTFLRPDGNEGDAPPVGVMLLGRGVRGVAAVENFARLTGLPCWVRE